MHNRIIKISLKKYQDAIINVDYAPNLQIFLLFAAVLKKSFFRYIWFLNLPPFHAGVTQCSPSLSSGLVLSSTLRCSQAISQSTKQFILYFWKTDSLNPVLLSPSCFCGNYLKVCFKLSSSQTVSPPHYRRYGTQIQHGIKPRLRFP